MSPYVLLKVSAIPGEEIVTIWAFGCSFPDHSFHMYAYPQCLRDDVQWHIWMIDLGMSSNFILRNRFLTHWARKTLFDYVRVGFEMSLKLVFIRCAVLASFRGTLQQDV